MAQRTLSVKISGDTRQFTRMMAWPPWRRSLSRLVRRWL